MRRFLAPLALLALAPTPALAEVVPANFSCIDTAADPAKFELARGIVNASVPDDQTDQMMRQLLGSVLQMMDSSREFPIDDPEVRAIYDRRMKELPDRLMPILNKHLPQIYGAVACAYVREFSLAELTEINAFARTPAGRHFLSQSPKLMTDPDVQKAFQVYMVDVQQMARGFGQEIAMEISDLLAKRKAKKR